MPTEYYLGVGTLFLALLIGFGASAFPRAIPPLAVLLLAGAFTATPITHTTDYRKMLAEMRSKCSECPIVVGVGYMGAIPACVLYEAKGMRVLLLGSNDTVGQVVRRIGDQQNIFMIPANEPATAQIERRLVEACPSRRENGYFEIHLTQGGSCDAFAPNEPSFEALRMWFTHMAACCVCSASTVRQVGVRRGIALVDRIKRQLEPGRYT